MLRLRTPCPSWNKKCFAAQRMPDTLELCPSTTTSIMDFDGRLAKVSSLYGPGTVGGWLFTLLSVLVTWTANPRSRRKDTITNDFIATLALPIISTMHLLHQIRTSAHSVRSILTSQDLDSLQSAAAIEAPLNVCETFSAAVLVLFGFLYYPDMPCGRSVFSSLDSSASRPSLYSSLEPSAQTHHSSLSPGHSCSTLKE